VRAARTSPNCVQIGEVPVAAAEDTCRELQRLAEAAPDPETVNLRDLRISRPGESRRPT
jgi:hypothetical protein